VNFQTEAKNQSKGSSNTDNKELISQLEQKVSIAVWIKFIGSILEAIYLSKILLLSEEDRSDPNKRQVLQGIWIQTIGQFIDSYGVTKQALTSDETVKFDGQEISNIGDWMQVIGGVLESYAGTQIIIEDKEELVSDLFVP
jgi:hypothetical protein